MEVDLTELRDPLTRKLERELELELGDKYFMDLKKHYLLKNSEEKYDVVPEIWEGHNIIDFVDMNIVEVSFYYMFLSKNLNFQKFKTLKEEEKKREEAGLYALDLDDDDEETTALLMQAEKIKEKEDLLRMESRLKRVEKPRMSRKLGRKRDRTISRLEEEMNELGVDIKKKRMSHFIEEQEREQTGNIFY